MELTLERPGDHLFVHSVSSKGIRIAEETHTGPIIVSASRVITDWPVSSARDIEESHLESILQLAPEIVLIGTGRKQVFLAPELMMYFYSRGLGAEIMSTDAACRTFNILVAESRNVVAALLPM